MVRRRQGLQYYAIVFAIVQFLPIREVRMGFDVNHCWFDSRTSKIPFTCSSPTSDNPMGLAPSLVHQAVRRPPCIQQCHHFVINHISIRIPRVPFISWLEGKGCVDEIKIDEVEVKFFETGIESGFDKLGTMIVIMLVAFFINPLPLSLNIPSNILIN